MTNPVKAFKLVSGEELVAEVIGSSLATGAHQLKRPHVLQFQQMGPGQFGLAFVPWALSNPGIATVELPKSAVIAEFEPAEKVAREYLSQTSGISLDTSGLKM